MLKEYIKSKVNEIDKMSFFEASELCGETRNIVKSFLTSSLVGLLDEIEKEAEKLKVITPDQKPDLTEEEMIAYNAAILDFITLLKKERGDVTKKV